MPVVLEQAIRQGFENPQPFGGFVLYNGHAVPFMWCLGNFARQPIFGFWSSFCTLAVLRSNKPVLRGVFTTKAAALYEFVYSFEPQLERIFVWTGNLSAADFRVRLFSFQTLLF